MCCARERVPTRALENWTRAITLITTVMVRSIAPVRNGTAESDLDDSVKINDSIIRQASVGTSWHLVRQTASATFAWRALPAQGGGYD